jgi:hypothetical protein
MTRDALTAPPPRTTAAECVACRRTTHAPVPVRTGPAGIHHACPHCAPHLTPGPSHHDMQKENEMTGSTPRSGGGGDGLPGEPWPGPPVPPTPDGGPGVPNPPRKGNGS